MKLELANCLCIKVKLINDFIIHSTFWWSARLATTHGLCVKPSTKGLIDRFILKYLTGNVWISLFYAGVLYNRPLFPTSTGVLLPFSELTTYNKFDSSAFFSAQTQQQTTGLSSPLLYFPPLISIILWLVWASLADYEELNVSVVLVTFPSCSQKVDLKIVGPFWSPVWFFFLSFCRTSWGI